MIDLATVTRTTFEPHVGERFTMHAPTRIIELELIAVGSVPTPPGAKRESFSLRFRANEREHVPQRIYELEHATIGAMGIFLVPVGPDAVGMLYDAVFS